MSTDLATWTELVDGYRHRLANTPAARPSSRRALSLRASPQRHWIPHKPRDPALIEPVLAEAIQRVTAGAAPWPLVLTGPAGVGKTSAALCLLDHAGGYYYPAGSWADEILAASKGQLIYPESGRVLTKADLWREIGDTSLVVLDELAARGRVSDWHYDAVKQLLDLRETRPLVVLSNLDLEAIAGLYDDRVASRLAAGTVVRLEGADRRLT